MYKEYPERTLDRITGAIELVLLISGCLSGLLLLVF